MALETLKGVKKIGNCNVVVMDDLREEFPEKFNESGAMDWQWFETEVRPVNFIYVRNDKNSLSFTMQNGTVRENGVNGCQVDDVIGAAKLILKGLNEKFPCAENESAIGHLGLALEWLERRTLDRKARNVEGKAKL